MARLPAREGPAPAPVWVPDSEEVRETYIQALMLELGLTRYRAIAGFRSGPADEFWEKTAPFWAEVRAAWDAALAGRERIELRRQHEGLSLFEHLMDQAELVEIEGFERDRDRAFARATIPLYVGEEDAEGAGGMEKAE